MDPAKEFFLWLTIAIIVIALKVLGSWLAKLEDRQIDLEAAMKRKGD